MKFQKISFRQPEPCRNIRRHIIGAFRLVPGKRAPLYVQKIKNKKENRKNENYRHPFDTYDGQDVLIFEEFRGGLKHGDMLNYLDGYPLLLPCRYFNRQACYTKVFIITNIPPDSQYMNVDLASREAFYRRIHKVVEFCDNAKFIEYACVQAYIDRHKWADDLDDIHAAELDQLTL